MPPPAQSQIESSDTDEQKKWYNSLWYSILAILFAGLVIYNWQPSFVGVDFIDNIIDYAIIYSIITILIIVVPMRFRAKDKLAATDLEQLYAIRGYRKWHDSPLYRIFVIIFSLGLVRNWLEPSLGSYFVMLPVIGVILIMYMGPVFLETEDKQ